jgi:hypothetical protein
MREANVAVRLRSLVCLGSIEALDRVGLIETVQKRPRTY